MIKSWKDAPPFTNFIYTIRSQLKMFQCRGTHEVAIKARFLLDLYFESAEERKYFHFFHGLCF